MKGSADEKNYVNIKRPPAPHAHTVRTTLQSRWAPNGGVNRSKHTPFPGHRLDPPQVPTDRKGSALRKGPVVKRRSCHLSKKPRPWIQTDPHSTPGPARQRLPDSRAGSVTAEDTQVPPLARSRRLPVGIRRLGAHGTRGASAAPCSQSRTCAAGAAWLGLSSASSRLAPRALQTHRCSC